MVNTQLSVDISNGTNAKIMRVFDTSFYYMDQELDNYMLEVLPVNKDKWVTFYIRKGFVLTLNSSNLRYKVVSDHDQLIALPDGIYELKQSYKPNILTINQFYHFRITDMSNRIQEQKSKLLSDKCSISKSEYVINRDKLRDIEEYVLAAKWMVEEEHDKTKGKELYEYAKALLERYTNECQC